MAGLCTGPGPCDAKSFGSGDNWVNRRGGLPPYVRAVAHAFQRGGMTESAAIARAIGVIRNWAQGKGNVTAATRARAAAALADWEAKRGASHSLTAAQSAVLDLAAVNGHHVAGSAYHYSHNWRPLDVRTALANRQHARARALHAAGANYHNPEPSRLGFVNGVKGLEIRKAEKPKIVEPPAAPKTVTSSAVQLKALIKSMPAEERTKPHLWGDSTLQKAAELGHDRAKTHLAVRDQIKARFRQQAERHAAYNAKRAERGEPPIPFTEPSHPQLQDLERRQVARNLRDEREMLKREHAQEAARAAKAKAEASPEHTAAVVERITNEFGTSSRYNWSSSALKEAAAAGDAQAVRALPYVEKREKKQALARKKADEIAGRAAAGAAPAGAPVSSALDNRTKGKTAEGVQRALAAIDKVHSDGELYKIPVKPSAAGTRYGQYTGAADKSGVSDKITISGGGDHHALTTAHEIGHWLDVRALNPDGQIAPHATSGRFASEDAANAGHHQLGYGMTPPASPAWDAWWKAVTESEAVNGLRTTPVPGSSPKYRNYTLTPREIWARSYAQYIAHRSGDTKMQQEAADLVALRQLDDHRALQGYTQWTPQDFAPVAAAIDRILAEKGWRK